MRRESEEEKEEGEQDRAGEQEWDQGPEIKREQESTNATDTKNGHEKKKEGGH